MQLTLALFSGLFRVGKVNAAAVLQRERNLTCFAGLFAHMTGFAMIHVWCNVQHHHFSASPLHALGVLPVACGGFAAFGLASYAMRKLLRRFAEKKSSTDENT